MDVTLSSKVNFYTLFGYNFQDTQLDNYSLCWYKKVKSEKMCRLISLKNYLIIVYFPFKLKT